jgi:hypothetical protein
MYNLYTKRSVPFRTQLRGPRSLLLFPQRAFQDTAARTSFIIVVSAACLSGHSCEDLVHYCYFRSVPFRTQLRGPRSLLLFPQRSFQDTAARTSFIIVISAACLSGHSYEDLVHYCCFRSVPFSKIRLPYYSSK